MSEFEETDGTCPLCGQQYDDEPDWQAHMDFCEDDLIEQANLGDPDE